MRGSLEIFYRSDGSYAAPVVAGDTLEVSAPVRLFRGPYVTVGRPEFDASPDGQRFLMMREPPQPAATSIGLITNFFEELDRLAPVDLGRSYRSVVRCGPSSFLEALPGGPRPTAC